MDHVIMFREVSGIGIGSRNFDVQAVCSCEWESDIHGPEDSIRARIQASNHLIEYGVVPKISVGR